MSQSRPLALRHVSDEAVKADASGARWHRC